MTDTQKTLYNKSEILNDVAKRKIEEILKNGNDAVIRRKGNGIQVLEDSKKIKYDTSVIGRK